MVLPVLNAHCLTARVMIGPNDSVKRIVPYAYTMEDWCGFLFDWIPLFLDKMVSDLKSLGRLIVFGGIGGGGCCRTEVRSSSLEQSNQFPSCSRGGAPYGVRQQQQQKPQVAMVVYQQQR